MARWAPDARGRLELAAMELFGEHGYESTTVAAIAERAGLTERTFFRYYADKREVLFWGARALQDVLVDRVDHAPADLSAIEAVTAALAAAGDEIFVGRHGYAGRRQAVIDANPELQERELIKLARLAAALADALRRRGVGDPAADLAAEAGIAVFRVAFGSWIHGGGDRTLSDYILESSDELRDVTGGRGRLRPD